MSEHDLLKLICICQQNNLNIMMHNRRSMQAKQKPSFSYPLNNDQHERYQESEEYSHREFHKLQERVRQLQEETKQQKKENQQLRRLVKILTNQKQYYNSSINEIQKQKNILYEQSSKLRLDNDSKSLLVNQLKKTNRGLVEETNRLKETLEETQFMFNAQEQQIDRIKRQKQLIECEWNRVIKQINQKMNKMVECSEEADKQNRFTTANLPLDHRVKQILHRIDHNLKNDEPLINKDLNNSSTLEDKSSNENIFQLSI